MNEVFNPFEIIAGDRSRGIVILCDHARRDLPANYGTLGLPDDQLQRHIAFDIGVREVTYKLAATLGVPAVLSTFSRLLIDPNRGHDDPTLVMRISDGALIPGNARIESEEIENRKALFYEPYHHAIAQELEAIEEEAGIEAAMIVSIHSFTPVWRGRDRPWHAAILWDSDPRLAVPMIEGLRNDPALMVGDNEPYDGALLNDCMFRHGTSKGRANALVEVRQDLIADDAGTSHWADRLHNVLEPLLRDKTLCQKKLFPSRAVAKSGGLLK